MPHKESFKLIKVKEQHPTFAAEISGVDFSQPIPEDVFFEIQAAITKYGVLVFRKTNLSDPQHISFASLFGTLDDTTPYLAMGRGNRFHPHIHLFDVSNLNDDGSICPPSSLRFTLNRGNTLFHVDSSFNPRRASYSLLRAAKLPPKGTGGATAFADTRTAWETLDEGLKEEVLGRGLVGVHSIWQSRKAAAPESEYLKDIDPETRGLSRHRLVQRHEPSGRMNLYIASHIHHLETENGEVLEDGGRELLEKLYGWAKQERFQTTVEWKNDGDLLVWDNTCVMHRAVGGAYEGKFVRDMRRATVLDGSGQAWGLNDKDAARQGMH